MPNRYKNGMRHVRYPNKRVMSTYDIVKFQPIVRDEKAQQQADKMLPLLRKKLRGCPDWSEEQHERFELLLSKIPWHLSSNKELEIDRAIHATNRILQSPVVDIYAPRVQEMINRARGQLFVPHPEYFCERAWGDGGIPTEKEEWLSQQWMLLLGVPVTTPEAQKEAERREQRNQIPSPNYFYLGFEVHTLNKRGNEFDFTEPIELDPAHPRRAMRAPRASTPPMSGENHPRPPDPPDREHNLLRLAARNGMVKEAVADDDGRVKAAARAVKETPARTAQTLPVRPLTAETLAKIDAHHAAETAKHRAELDQQAELRRQAEEAKAMRKPKAYSKKGASGPERVAKAPTEQPTLDEQARELVRKHDSIEAERQHELELKKKEALRVAQQEERH